LEIVPLFTEDLFVLLSLLLIFRTVELMRDIVLVIAKYLLVKLTEQRSMSHPYASGVKGDAGHGLLPLMLSAVLACGQAFKRGPRLAHADRGELYKFVLGLEFYN